MAGQTRSRHSAYQKSILPYNPPYQDTDRGNVKNASEKPNENWRNFCRIRPATGQNAPNKQTTARSPLLHAKHDTEIPPRTWQWKIYKDRMATCGKDTTTSLLLYDTNWTSDDNPLQTLSWKAAGTIPSSPPISVNGEQTQEKTHGHSRAYKYQRYSKYHCILRYEVQFPPSFEAYSFSLLYTG